MTIYQQPPTEGQFVMVWWHNNIVWSDVFRWNSDGELEQHRIVDDTDDWTPVSDYNLAIDNALFVT